MTNYEERQVRRILGKLRASELIGYDKHSKDFRGPNRPTNTYTLKPENIQRLIDAGKVVVAKALETYYDKRSVPKHNKKAPVKMSGHSQEQPVKMSGQTTGQDVPQDVSLSIEQRQDERQEQYVRQTSITEEMNTVQKGVECIPLPANVLEVLPVEKESNTTLPVNLVSKNKHPLPPDLRLDDRNWGEPFAFKPPVIAQHGSGKPLAPISHEKIEKGCLFWHKHFVERDLRQRTETAL
jgi:hypothetical protein